LATGQKKNKATGNVIGRAPLQQDDRSLLRLDVAEPADEANENIAPIRRPDAE
jgi:hypothetical protein